jgi:hypothetical protein
MWNVAYEQRHTALSSGVDYKRTDLYSDIRNATIRGIMRNYIRVCIIIYFQYNAWVGLYYNHSNETYPHAYYTQARAPFSFRLVETFDAEGYGSNRSKALFYQGPTTGKFDMVGSYMTAAGQTNASCVYIAQTTGVYTVDEYVYCSLVLYINSFSCNRTRQAICEIYYDNVCDALTPCQNNGSCTPDAIQPQRNYYCTCTDGWEGSMCEQRRF